MEKHIVPLNELDYKYIKKRQRSFIIECIKRYLGIGIMVAFLFSLRFLIKSFKDVDFSVFYWIFVGVVVVFTGINVFLFRKFYSRALFKDKTVAKGTIQEKGYSHAQEGSFQFEVDNEKKILNFSYIDKLGVANGIKFIRLNYDKKSFDGLIPTSEYLYFILDGQQLKVDVSHFAVFNIGEKIQIEQLNETGELMRISSLDDPEKIIELNTFKFFIGREGIKAFGN